MSEVETTDLSQLRVSTGPPAALLSGEQYGSETVHELPRVNATESASTSGMIEQDLSFGIAGKVWDAVYFTSLYLTAPAPAKKLAPNVPASSAGRQKVFMPAPDMLYPKQTDRINRGLESRPLTVLELGCGTGYLGLHVARQLARWHAVHKCHAEATVSSAEAMPKALVVLTDLRAALPLAERNLTIYRQNIDANKSLGSLDDSVQVWVRPLHWGSVEDATVLAQEVRDTFNVSDTPVWDVVIGSDLVYFPELYQPLLDTLCEVCGERTLLVLGWRCRQLWREAPFWEKFGQHFIFEAVRIKSVPVEVSDTSNLGQGYKGTDDDDGDDDEMFFGEDEGAWVFVARRRAAEDEAARLASNWVDDQLHTIMLSCIRL